MSPIFGLNKISQCLPEKRRRDTLEYSFLFIDTNIINILFIIITQHTTIFQQIDCVLFEKGSKNGRT